MRNKLIFCALIAHLIFAKELIVGGKKIRTGHKLNLLEAKSSEITPELIELPCEWFDAFRDWNDLLFEKIAEKRETEVAGAAFVWLSCLWVQDKLFGRTLSAPMDLPPRLSCYSKWMRPHDFDWENGQVGKYVQHHHRPAGKEYVVSQKVFS